MVKDIEKIINAYNVCLNKEIDECPAGNIAIDCLGSSCEYFEERNLGDYREWYANFLLVTGPKLEPSVDLAQFRTND